MADDARQSDQQTAVAEDAGGDYPRSMEEVYQYLERSRSALLAVVEPRSDEEIGRIGPEGWSVKDHLAHLAVWEGSMTAILNGGDKGEALGVTPEVMATPGFDEINEVIRARWATASRAKVMEMLAAKRRELQATLGGMTYEDLMKPYASYQPGSPEKTDPVAYWLAGNTWEHEDEHRPWIEGLLKEVRGARR